MHLWGDKDHEKVLDIVTKFEKSHRKASREGVNRVLREARAPRLFNMRCHLSNKRGHFRASCPERRPVPSREAKSGK